MLAERGFGCAIRFESRLRAVRLAAAGTSIAEVARRQGASRSTVHRWRCRYTAEGAAGLRERSSRPHRSPRRLTAQAEAEIAALRLATGAGPVALGAALGRPASTVGKVLQRLGLSCPQREPKPAFARYERERAGELLHVDIKKLGRFWWPGKAMLADERRMLSRGAGWQFLHVAVDDRSRPACAELLPSERAEHAVAFLRRAAPRAGTPRRASKSSRRD